MTEDSRCGACRFAFPLDNAADASCQRFPPVALESGGQVLSFWPTVSNNSVCGEFQPAKAQPVLVRQPAPEPS